MTVSELMKESKSLRKGFKFNYLCTLILSLLIIIAYLFAALCVFETTKIYENGVNNSIQGKPYFQGYENLFDTQFKYEAPLENTGNQNASGIGLNEKNNSSDTTNSQKCLCAKKKSI